MQRAAYFHHCDFNASNPPAIINDMIKRCAWADSTPLMSEYHDNEWGVPVHDDRMLFELLTLEGAQAGLSWSTILNKRRNYRTAFANFDPYKVARFDRRKVEALMSNAGIVRNRLKIESTISNAQALLAVQLQSGTFDRYLWNFVDGSPIRNRWRVPAQVPASTPLSDLISKDLKVKGFRFVGSTICYAFMQAGGMVDDHLATCDRSVRLRP
jgi:DNA-3-methyladenine glycosylase I